MSNHPTPLPELTGEIRALVADQDGIYAEGLRHLIASLDIECSVLTDAPSVLEFVRERPPDLIVLDHILAGNGVLDSLLETPIKPRVLYLSPHPDTGLALRLLRRGARGCIARTESVPEVVVAVQTVVAGGRYVHPQLQKSMVFDAFFDPTSAASSRLASLTRRESQILEMISEKCSTKVIAERCGLSVKTVETHRGKIKEKLRINSAQELQEFAVCLRIAGGRLPTALVARPSVHSEA